MMKQRSRLLAMLCAAILLVGTVPAYAAGYIFDPDITTSKIYLKFGYGNGGNTITAKLNYTEKHSQTGQVYSSTCSNTVTGIYTESVTGKNADSGYKFTKMDAYGLLNSNIYTQMLDLTP